jgi:hypothetical protein
VLEPQDFAYLDVTFPKRVIDVIKDGFWATARARSSRRSLSSSGAAAPEWSSRTPLVFAANARRHVGVSQGRVLRQLHQVASGERGPQ